MAGDIQPGARVRVDLSAHIGTVIKKHDGERWLVKYDDGVRALLTEYSLNVLPDAVDVLIDEVEDGH